MEDFHPRCEACDYQKLKKLEHNPVIRELRDKIEQLNFRLAECKNENHALKRNLQMVKKLVYKETGACSSDFQEMLKFCSKSNQKARTENIIQLQRKVQELKDYLDRLERNIPAQKVTVSEEYVEESSTSKNVVWKKELDHRLAKKTDEKILNPLLEECTDLRKRLDAERKRFKELSGEVNLFRAEIESQIHKNKEDMGIIKSYQTIECQLQEMLAERAKIRNDLAGSNACNNRLEVEITALKDELQSVSNKAKDNNLLIDSYTKKHKHIQEAIETEKSIVQQKMDLYQSELQKLKHAYEENVTLLESLQNLIYERHQMLKTIEEHGNSGFTVYFTQENNNTYFQRDENESHSSNSIDVESKNEVSVENSSHLDHRGIEEDIEPNSIKLLRVLIDLAKYKTLTEAAEIEKDRVLYIIQIQESQMNEIALQVVEAGRLMVQKDSEKKLLLERVCQLQRSLSAKKEKDTCNLAKNNIEELKNKTDSLTEENEFLRSYMQSIIVNQANDLSLYKKFAHESKEFLLEAIQDFSKTFNEKKQYFVSNSSEISENQESTDA